MDLFIGFFLNSVNYYNGFLYFLSSVAQSAAAFAALVAVFAVFRFQANNDIIKGIYREINKWLVKQNRSSYIDRDPPELIRDKIEAAAQEKMTNVDITQAKSFYKRLESAEDFPKNLAYKVSKPLKQWAIICFLSLLALVVFDISVVRTKGSILLVAVALLGLTAHALHKTKKFVQECLRS